MINEAFALMRAKALRACVRMSGYISTDRVLLAELFLRGDIAISDEYAGSRLGWP